MLSSTVTNFYGISLYRMPISSENKVNALFVTLIAPLLKAVNIGSPFILLHIRSADNDEGT